MIVKVVKKYIEVFEIFEVRKDDEMLEIGIKGDCKGELSCVGFVVVDLEGYLGVICFGFDLFVMIGLEWNGK